MQGLQQQTLRCIGMACTQACSRHLAGPVTRQCPPLPSKHPGQCTTPRHLRFKEIHGGWYSCYIKPCPLQPRRCRGAALTSPRTVVSILPWPRGSWLSDSRAAACMASREAVSPASLEGTAWVQTFSATRCSSWESTLSQTIGPSRLLALHMQQTLLLQLLAVNILRDDRTQQGAGPAGAGFSVKHYVELPGVSWQPLHQPSARGTVSEL